MLLSIIIPCYNMEADNKISFCLDSVLSQTISDYEVICVDDCSTDNTLGILCDYKNRYPEKIKVIAHKKNKKQGGARNSGLAIAQGDYIGFVDADDFVAPDMYEKLLAKALESGADCVGCDYAIAYHHDFAIPFQSNLVRFGSKLETGILSKNGKTKILLHGGSVCSKIYKRELIFNYQERFPANVFFEDNCIMSLVYSRVKHLEFINEPLYYYFKSPESTTSSFSMKKFNDRLNSGRCIVRYAKQYGYFDEYRNEIEALFIRIFYVNTLFYCAQYTPFSNTFLVGSLNMTREIKRTFPDYLKNPYWNDEYSKKTYMLIKIGKYITIAPYFLLSLFFLTKKIQMSFRFCLRLLIKFFQKTSCVGTT